MMSRRKSGRSLQIQIVFAGIAATMAPTESAWGLHDHGLPRSRKRIVLHTSSSDCSTIASGGEIET
ncbi:hypothetical protein EJB05_46153 [Eragrostis curvula]|uniref:Uncharacterized protein n=1 Tax=Eragrostis curvula TaxID=38414 RepID=A0A5J9TME9_9POAL|nr:hypothetical protein EJB05_46153 [Eragrostis curvula]